MTGIVFGVVTVGAFLLVATCGKLDSYRVFA